LILSLLELVIIPHPLSLLVPGRQIQCPETLIAQVADLEIRPKHKRTAPDTQILPSARPEYGRRGGLASSPELENLCALQLAWSVLLEDYDGTPTS
jgi:hypothetical protein